MGFYLKVLEITLLHTILVLGAYLMTGLTEIGRASCRERV